ncbi:MAG: tRNA-dihydrouridine synthase, partial [Opitutales bacterium]|nr:tRNA-dihydrouridine synthase [Opitutales bacterium]
MEHCSQRVPLPEPTLKGTMLTSLAPMQDVTDLPFMKVMHRYGSPDYFFTEYFRVYPNSRLDRHILRSITENPSDRPVYAQLLGNSLDDIKRIVPQLENHPIAGVDLNVGCPAPKIYKNAAG